MFFVKLCIMLWLCMHGCALNVTCGCVNYDTVSRVVAIAVCAAPQWPRLILSKLPAEYVLDMHRLLYSPSTSFHIHSCLFPFSPVSLSLLKA